MDQSIQERLPLQLLQESANRLRRLIVRLQQMTRHEILMCLVTSQRELLEALEFYTNEVHLELRR